MSRKWVFSVTRSQTANVIIKANSREEAQIKGRKLMDSGVFWETYGDRLESEHPKVRAAQDWHKGIPEA